MNFPTVRFGDYTLNQLKALVPVSGDGSIVNVPKSFEYVGEHANGDQYKAHVDQYWRNSDYVQLSRRYGKDGYTRFVDRETSFVFDKTGVNSQLHAFDKFSPKPVFTPKEGLAVLNG